MAEPDIFAYHLSDEDHAPPELHFALDVGWAATLLPEAGPVFRAPRSTEEAVSLTIVDAFALYYLRLRDIPRIVWRRAERQAWLSVGRRLPTRANREMHAATARALDRVLARLHDPDDLTGQDA